MPSRSDPLAQLRTDLGTLLDRSDITSRRQFGRDLGWKTGEEMVRLFLDGQTDISLEKAGEWAKRCGATLRAIPVEDPWASLDVAIAALPKDEVTLKRHLRALVRSDRVSTAQATRRGRASPRDSRRAV